MMAIKLYVMKGIRKLTKEELEIEGNTLGQQMSDWNDVFDLLMMVRKYKLSELQAYSILSNRYKLEPTKTK